jgi:hypothetical protein
MNAVAITCDDNGKRSFLKWKRVLGAPDTLETVAFKDATFFTDPELVEDLLRQFTLPDPKVELLDVKHVRSIVDNKDKYSVYVQMLSGDDHSTEAHNKSSSGKKDRTYVEYHRFVFAELWRIKNPDKSHLEYDIAYEMILDSHEEFVHSRFNDPNEPLVESIERFLNSKERR